MLAVMVVGYAAFASQLTINTTSEITSKWDVEITNITPKIPSGSGATDNASTCDESGTPKACGNSLTASVSSNLISPGDSIIYRIEVTNKGSLNAILNRININAEASNDIGYYINKDKSNQKISENGYRMLEKNGILNPYGDTDVLDKGYVYLTIYYKDYENQVAPPFSECSAEGIAKIQTISDGQAYVGITSSVHCGAYISNGNSTCFE